MYWSLPTSAPGVDMIWLGDSIVEPGVGHRSDPVLGMDLVFTIDGDGGSVVLQGPVTRRVVYPHRSDAQYIGVRFVPGAIAGADGLHVSELRDGAAPIDALGPVDLRAALGCLLELDDDLDARAQAVRSHVLPAVFQLEPPALIAAALDRLGSHPALTVRCLAADLGVSERRLQRDFRRHVGLSPKHVGRLVRAQRFVRVIDDLVADDRAVDLASVAAACGFFDQAHLTNEVGRVLGVTPRRLVDEAALLPPRSARRGFQN